MADLRQDGGRTERGVQSESAQQDGGRTERGVQSEEF